MANAILPSGEQQFSDADGKPYVGGKVYFYIPNTLTPKNTYQDQDSTILNTNPVILDSAGRAVIWGEGNYRQILNDKNGNTVWDRIVSYLKGTEAASVSIVDAGNYYTDKNVEGALQELGPVIGDTGDKYIYGTMAFGSAVRQRQYDRNANEVSVFEVFDSATQSAIRDGTVTADLSVKMNELLAEADVKNLFVPKGIFPVDTGLTSSSDRNVRWSAGAKIVPRGSGVTGALLTIDGSDASADPSISEEHAIRTRWDRIQVDGLNRYPGLSGVVVKNVLRSDFGPVISENVAGSALSLADSVKECTFDLVRAKYCGEIIDDGMGGFIESPVLDIYQPTSARDPHNNLHFKSFFSIYGMGPDLRVAGSLSNTSRPRRIFFDWMMIHGPIDVLFPPTSSSDPGNPYKLTDAQRIHRRQIIAGWCDELFLNQGSVQFAATAAYPIHITSEQSSDGQVYFGPLRVHQRWDYSGLYEPVSNYGGLLAEKGIVYNDGLRFFAGYTGYNAFEASSGVQVHWNAAKTYIGTGSVSIADTFEIFHRKTVHNFGAQALKNVGGINFSATAASLYEGKSGSAIAAAIIDYAAASARARVRIPAQSVLEFTNQTAPTAANLIADGVNPCLFVVSGVPKFFDGTAIKTITVT